MSFPKLEGYVFTEKLGSGSYSTVYKAYTKIGARTVVAVKCIDKSRVKHSGSAVDNLVTEIRLMKSFTHPHIVHMKEFTWDAKNIYIIMEYCCGGDLSKYIHKYGKVPETQVLYFLQQLASALKYLREKGVAHMDLKPHNLLLHKGSDGKYVLKVGDFGFAQHLSSEPARSLRGSPLYMAPEMLAGEYDARADLWSTGVIMYECLFGRAPYSSDSLPELLEKVQRRAPVQIPPTPRVSPGCRELLVALLRHDPGARISYEEFFAHPYLDLDHMPSRENYDKAVSLIRQAVELETAGELRPALRCYGDALRYLLPAARAEPDAVRRSALTAKLTRYMERAEEIKRYLKCSQPDVPSAVGGNGLQQDVPSATGGEVPRGGAPQPAGRSACCTGEASGNSYDFSGTTMNPNNTKDSINYSNSINGHDKTGVPNNKTGVPNNKTGDQNNKNVVPNDSVSIQDGDKACGNELATQNKGKPEKPRGFARFFGKPVPYLDRDNSVEDTKKTDKIEDNAGDMCKIT